MYKSFGYSSQCTFAGADGADLCHRYKKILKKRNVLALQSQNQIILAPLGPCFVSFKNEKNVFNVRNLKFV